MTREEAISKINEALAAYSDIGEISLCDPYGNGHINDTFLVVASSGRYILQRINDNVFPRPDKIMENIVMVTTHIRKKLGDSQDNRSCLTVVDTNDGEHFFRDSIGSFWRLYAFVEDSVAKEKSDGIDDFHAAAVAFGNFQKMLSDFPAEKLNEAIADFHNTPKRLENLKKSIKSNVCGRTEEVKAEIDFALAREDFAHTLENAHENGTLPLRVTHNDTKLNNILFDKQSGSPVCVIDLDTVMPGYSVNDFGDSIRFGASTAAEDETDLGLVKLDLNLFAAFAEGFITSCGEGLTNEEAMLLPVGAMMMTFECGMRFLTDYIDGDIYFRTHRPGHNLDRCRNQFALLADMEAKLEEMTKIVENIIKQR